ncbi:hypothetical protein Poly30_52960 [Planctomycetes bacterium Poly30]|uniref:DUF1598 domain-containing protein n=1 Tax=Saltatorellus ferox TaxID=2528018 RepID=A0A518F074_9BACT|nr:hypothetical protein Poly30_52960 [Planctomycetes bacterium Poly30]
MVRLQRLRFAVPISFPTVGLSLLAFGATPLLAATQPQEPASPRRSGQTADQDFYRAYYLEHEKGDLDAAMELYRSAVRSGSLTPEQREEIESHLRACAEELATGDLAQLVPGDSIVYFELNEPGDQLQSLLNQLGLLQGTDRAGDIAVSPHLLEGILGLKGAAIALTRIDPSAGMPGGVVVLHPGDMGAVRGLIETALPAGGQSVEPIAGHPTFLVEGMVHVTMGRRLIVAGTERQLIEDVLRRVDGDRSDSLAASDSARAALAGHGDDLFFFCANAEPVMPLIETALGVLGGQSREAALAIQLLDPDSLRTLSGGVGVRDGNLSLDLGLTLEEGHRNLAFNLLRMPHVSESTFEMIPSGVAGFMATSLNEKNPGGTGVTDSEGRPVVTIMDLGREVFGNLVDVALFVLPSMSEGPGGMPVPDAAIAMSVNDPERSQAIWRLALGLAQGASGENGQMQARTNRIGSREVERFQIEGIDVFLYRHDDRLVISPSLAAIEAAVQAAEGRNIKTDALFAGLAGTALHDRTSVAGISMGRVAKIARQVMPERELREVGPYLDLLNEASIVATTRHSDTEWRWSSKIAGLPNVGPLVSDLVHAEMGRGGAGRTRPEWSPQGASEAIEFRAASGAEARSTGGGHQLALAPASGAPSSGTTMGHFEALLAEGNVEAASALVPVLAKDFTGHPQKANQFVWDLISTESGEALAPALLPIIEEAVEASQGTSWFILDTLAHVQFAAGDVQGAIQTERKAVQVARDHDDPRGREAEAALARFVKLAKKELLR